MNNITIELSQEDRKVLSCLTAAINNLVELLAQTTPTAAAPHQDAPAPTGATKEAEPIKTPATEEKPAEEPQGPPWEEPATTAAPAPDRRTVKSLAVKKIQAGHRDEVKALIQAYGAEKIDLVPEDRLAAFVGDLEKIGG